MRSRFAALLFAAVASASVAVVGCRDEGNVLEGKPDVVLSDAEAAGILRALNLGEIVEAQLAVQRATNPAVIAFGDRMLVEHGAALDREQALFAQLGLEPAPSGARTELERQTEAELSMLGAQSGADFDRAYVDVQAEKHATAIRIIDTVLLGAALRPELQQEVMVLRQSVQEHLATALELKGAFGDAAAPPDAQVGDAAIDAVTVAFP